MLKTPWGDDDDGGSYLIGEEKNEVTAQYDADKDCFLDAFNFGNLG